MSPSVLSPVQYQSMPSAYGDICTQILHHGRRRSARGYVAHDVADACFTILDTRSLLPTDCGRDPSRKVAFAEALLLCAGVESPSLVTSASAGFRRFLDGGALAGSYGPLTRSQMPHVVETLSEDADSRQAVVQVHPGLQNVRGLRDVPCTINLGFELRDDGLHMRAVMRSNDVWLGLAYDAFMFGQLGWTVANCFGAPLVTYTHHAYSLHLYERNFDDVERLEFADGRSDEPTGFGRATDGRRWRFARDRAERVYDRNIADVSLTRSEEQYVHVLGPLDRLTRTDNFSS